VSPDSGSDTGPVIGHRFQREAPVLIDQRIGLHPALQQLLQLRLRKAGHVGEPGVGVQVDPRLGQSLS
jgi:hypothetical protein